MVIKITKNNFIVILDEIIVHFVILTKWTISEPTF